MPTSKPRTRFTARLADRHVLYQLAVQCPEAEIDFVDEWFKKIRGRRATTLREDFCGTGYTSCEWVRRRRGNIAHGLDIDQPTLDWGMAHNVAGLTASQRKRITLHKCDVRIPVRAARGTDIVLAMNFSYWLFTSREGLRAYFESVRRSMAKDGVFFLDSYAGYECMKEVRERRPISGKFTYIWDQHKYNPITGDMECRIHFAFNDGTRMNNAFTYHWRLWTLPELQELLREAGFKHVTVYCEGDDGEGGGDGNFQPTKECPADAGIIVYLTAHV